MSGNYLVLIPMVALWAAVLALAVLLIRVAGWEKVRRHTGPLAILALALLSLPAAGLVKLALPYRKRILARVSPQRSAPVAMTAGCSIFPADNVWNAPVSDLPVDPHSAAYIQSMGAALPLHADFGPAAGIPYATVTGDAAASEVSFGDFADQSDPGPYRFPDNTPMEDGPDAHAIAVDLDRCRLYELYAARHPAPGRWQAASGANYDLRSNRLRPADWTSADAAGLPVFPGLVRYDEVKAGRIGHALRFTAQRTRRAYMWPARHRASNADDPALPPMGQRFRLRAAVDLSGFSPEARVILTALKEYGMMLADNGSPWFLTGAPDGRWSSGLVAELRKITGADFEAVDVSGLMVQSDSGEARRR
jgi:hypothetical protein